MTRLFLVVVAVASMWNVVLVELQLNVRSLSSCFGLVFASGNFLLRVQMLHSTEILSAMVLAVVLLGSCCFGLRIRLAVCTPSVRCSL